MSEEIYEEQEEKNENTDSGNAFELLFRAIVEQAVKDYFKALDRNDKLEIMSIENFFRTGLFTLMYSEIDSKWFIKNLRELYESKKNNKRNDSKRA